MSETQAEDIKARRQANMAKARAAKVEARAARLRTAADAGRSGVAAMPDAARAEPAREETPHEEAAPRRRSRHERTVDSFALARHKMKSGRDYQWWPTAIMGMQVDASYATEIYEGGWQPERARDWRDLVLPETADAATVDRLGQRLYSRPMALTHEAKREDYDAAERQKLDRMRVAAEGRLSGNEESLSQVRGVRAVPLQLEVEGEAGTFVPRGG